MLVTAGVAAGGEAVSGAQSSEGEAGLVGNGQQRCLASSGLVLTRGLCLGTKAPWAVLEVRRRKGRHQEGLAETQEYEACPQKGTELGRKTRRTRRKSASLQGGERFDWVARTPWLKKGREPHTITNCMHCYSLRQEEKKEPAVRGKRWKIIAGEKGSRGKLSACLGATGFENKVWSGTQPNTCTATGKNWPGSRRAVKNWLCCERATALHLAGTLVRRAMKAGGGENDWSELLKCKDLNAWDEGKDTGVLPRSKAGRSAKKLYASDFAEEHGLHEADHRAS